MAVSDPGCLDRVGILRYFPFSPAGMIAAAFVVVTLQLKLMRSAVLPSLSAAILPLLLHCDNWYYPLSVCILTGVIAIGRQGIDYFIREETTVEFTGGAGDRNIHGKDAVEKLIHWSKLLTAVLIVTAFSLEYKMSFVIAPPLIVAFVELSKPNGILRQRPMAIFLLLVLAAFSGVFWLYLVAGILDWPVWISAALSMMSVYLLFDNLRISFPPAAAIGLLPTIIPSTSLWSYPWHVTIGSAAFILINLFGFRAGDAAPASMKSS